MNSYIVEPAYVRYCFAVEFVCTAFFVVDLALAIRAYARARRLGRIARSLRARRFWVYGGLIVFGLFGMYASAVIAYRREVQLKQLKAYEAAHNGDRRPREALIDELARERNLFVVFFGSFGLAGVAWRAAAHEEGWVGPEALRGTGA